MHAPTHTTHTHLARPRQPRSATSTAPATPTATRSPRTDRRSESRRRSGGRPGDDAGRGDEQRERRSRVCRACGGRVTTPPAALDGDEVGGSTRASKRARQAVEAATLAAGTVGLLGAPTSARAGPLPLETTRSLPPSVPAASFDSRHAATLTATPVPRPRPTLRKRIVPLLSWSDGDWIEDYGWTNWGPRPTSTSSPAEGGAGVTDQDPDAELQYAPATAMGDAIAPSSSSSPSPSPSSSPALASASSPTPTTTSTPSPTPTLPFHARYSAKVPPGWTPQPRETNFYAVPIIIAMSVLVAVIVVASIVVSVVLRRRKKRRRERRRERRAARKEAGGRAGVGERGGADGRRDDEKETREKGLRGVVGRLEDGLRRRNKGKKKASGGLDGDGGPPAPRRIVRTTGFAAGTRIKPRRRRRRADNGDGDEDEGDEATALTRTGTSSTTSSVVNDTLTARVAARLRRQDSATSPAGRGGAAGTTTVFSRDVNAQSAVSLTASALDRVSSQASASSRRTQLSPTPSGAERPAILFTPADDVTHPSHLALPGSSAPPSPSLTPTISRPLQPQPSIPPSPSLPQSDPSTSAFYRSLIVSDDSLPAPGPPAYRPSGSTVQATRRFGAGDAGAGPAIEGSRQQQQQRRGRRGVFGRREREAQEDDDEGEWYWPGEKGRSPFADSASAASTPAPPPLPEVAADDAPSSIVVDEPPVDRSLFTAHVATDDKAVLARLRAQRDVALADDEAGIVAGSSSSLPVPSAPVPENGEEEDPDVDADGFERYDLAEVGASPFDAEADRDSTPVASSSSSLLPAPPQRVHQPSLGARAGSTAPLLSSASIASTSSSSPFFAPDSSSSTEKADLAASYAAATDGVDEDDTLPLYLAGSGRSGAREALAMASAPPGDDDEDGGEWTSEVVRNEGAREDEGVV